MRIVLPVEVVHEHPRYSLGHVLPVLPERLELIVPAPQQATQTPAASAKTNAGTPGGNASNGSRSPDVGTSASRDRIRVEGAL